MKKLWVLFLTALMCLPLVACGGGSGRDVISSHDGTPALNMKTFDQHITRVELTVDNWQDYVREYSYEVEVVEKDAFGEITNVEKVTVYRLGYGTERYTCLDAIIEFRHKETGDMVTLGTYIANCVEDIKVISLEPLNLDEYECTRIKGYIYFIDYPEEVMEEVLQVYDRTRYDWENASITITSSYFDGNWGVDVEARVIESNSDNWRNLFE